MMGSLHEVGCYGMQDYYNVAQVMHLGRGE